MSYEDLLKKWEPVLEHPEFAQINDPYKKKVTAILLENQDRDMEEAKSGGYGSLNETTNVTGGVDKFDPVLISMIRRSMPNLIAFDVMGVQPMNGPSGLIFAMKSHYTSQSGDEALHPEADTSFAGTGNHAQSNPFHNAYSSGSGLDTADAELLGSGAAGAGNFGEMAMSIDKISVTAKSRALKAEYTTELAQDLKAIHNLDAESELANILSSEIMAEINREMIRKINLSALQGAADTNTPGEFDLDLDASGRWSVEKFKGLLFQIERDANAIAKATRRGSTFAGVLNGRYKVYIDPYVSGVEYYTLGYKGSSPYDAGMFYCPYVPLQMVRAMGENTFQPKIGFKTRYGLVANPFAVDNANNIGQADNKYYRAVKVTNLL